jgi:ribonuclease-3
MALSNHDVFDPYSVENLSALENKLGINVEDKELLKRAISTRLARNEHQGLITEDNECLEFLGDSVLKFLISETLFHEESTPEKMTNARMEMENNKVLGIVAKELDFKENLFLGGGEKLSTGKGELTLLANALEAIMGAVYMDEGNIESAKKFYREKLEGRLLELLSAQDVGSPVNRLQEVSQELYRKLPEYAIKQVAGTPDKPVFRAEVCVNGEKLGEAEGQSMKEARQRAAKQALLAIKG